MGTYFAELLGLSEVGSSLAAFARGISASSLILLALMGFMLVGLIDKLRGNPRGYGERFDAGFRALGDLALTMVGIIALSPVLMHALSPLVTPLFRALGMSPALFPASLLALDMGGYALSMRMAGEGGRALGLYAGLIVASTMGITMSFTLPYALGVLRRERHAALAEGMLLGLVALPVGCLTGGLLMGVTGNPLPLGALLLNTLPVLALAGVVALGLLRYPARTLRIFTGFGRALTLIVTVSPAIAAFQYVTGIHLPVFYRMVVYDEALGGVPLERALLIIGQIAVVLTGAFPMILFLSRALAGPLRRLGARAGMGEIACTGLLTQLANSIPMWAAFADMDERGRRINAAFAVCGSFAFGDTLAFVGSVERDMVFPVVMAKLVGAAVAAAIAMRWGGRVRAGKAEA